MRITRLLAAAMIVWLAAPAFAADAPKETPEATTARIRELEKANTVLHEDLARARLQLDMARESLAKTRTALDSETAARKALEEKLISAQQQTARDISSSSDALKSTMDARFAEMDKALKALSARHDTELAAAKSDYDQRLAAMQKANDEKVALLQAALDKEKDTRLALEKSLSLQLTQLGSRQRRERNWLLGLNGLGLAVTLFK